MKKAIIVEFNLMTRLAIDANDENVEKISELAKQNILDKINNNELSDNLSEWYDDEEMPYQEEKDVPVLFYTIKNKIGWGEWCDVTGGNHYALNEGYSPDASEVFYCTESQAKELGLL